MKVGKVKHYYDKIGVAIIDVLAELKIGDRIKIVRGGEDLFEQMIVSMQAEHKEIDKADKGDIIGMKTNEAVKEGAEIFKV
ncbi:hypothetical protein A2382_02245 [Candidatus Woesebacteria bacterium RIFOXYB1_FULL_38_16]|uniref:Translation elongation factor-like protein n=1 Tax=Candidatus Woesebacteria bacterium RIFOXYB1_FULL_38_16 TaxID=1802538 RepID=A0A1F8CVH2_9BACT|nr:MAG: hypothetical protein A2191_01900 [Candidatus Woesebacteria bacterium RIFOXYA1_FULL_38_9]OGM79555.1 MAG: hypothetical protein A2382_02245 [Candidatus Woesebacteria bacterium RIFOXYB1_FULL_38_16]